MLKLNIGEFFIEYGENNNIVLLISSGIYYIIFWILLYITLKFKINKVYIKEK